VQQTDDSNRPVSAGLLGPADAVLARISGAFSGIASTTIMVFMLLITADVLMRNLFSVPINGVSDFVAYAIVACVFIQLGSTIRDDRFIKADFLMGGWETDRPMLANGAKTIFYVAATAILVLAVRWLWEDFHKSWTTSEFTGAVGAYQLPLWPFKLAVVAGAALCTVETARVALIRGWAFLRALTREGGDRRGIAGFLIFAALLVAFVWVFLGGHLTPVQVGLMAFLGLFVLVACGMPVAFVLLAMSFLGIWLTRDNFNVANNGLGIAASGAVRSFEFGVVPLFVTMGLVLDRADVGRDAFQVAVVALRRMKGGLGVATVAANAIFAAITGSSIASAAVFSRVAAPAMDEAGYTRSFSTGVIAGSSVLGMLIPPSLLLIIYGLLAEVSIGALFIAAIIPGLILAFGFAVLNIVLATWFPDFVGRPKETVVEEMEFGTMLLRLLPVIFIIALVMGGIYGGLFSPTEAGAIGAFGAFLVAAARRKLDWPTIKSIALETGFITASILFLIIAANLYARMLTLSTIPMEATSLIASYNLELVAFVLVYILLVMLLGMILDSVSIMLVILPIAVPVVSALGGDLIWFGIITIIAIEIGLLTPPFGLSVFVVKGALPPGFVTLGEIFKGAAPFVVVMFIVTLLIVFVPSLALMLL
jgi:tripartite ATP-independent transporter DctM subunit